MPPALFRARLPNAMHTRRYSVGRTAAFATALSPGLDLIH